MSNHNPYLSGEAIAKTMQARVAMWSFMGTTLSLSVAASALLSAISGHKHPLIVVPIILFGLLGDVSLILCFYLVWVDRLDMPEDQAEYEQGTNEERAKKIWLVTHTPHPVRKWQRLAFVCLAVSVALFSLLAVLVAFDY
jgi:hypothetical protein